MSYGFDDIDDKKPIALPTQTKKKPSLKEQTGAAVEAGKVLGFVSREGQGRRKPGPKRSEPQGKITLTGPERVLSRFKAHCDEQGGIAYWEALEALLDAEKK